MNTRTMSLIHKLQAVLVDLSGTLHVEDHALPGALKAVQRLKNSSLDVKFVTNTTKESKTRLYQRLQKLGFDINTDDIFTSLTAARQVVEQEHLRPMLLLQDSAMQDFEGIMTENPNAVVIGLAPKCFNYQMLNAAFRLILEGHPLIAIHKARYYKRSDGLALGPGPFVEALEYATGTRARVIGKPQGSFFLGALKTIGCLPEKAVVIGDDAIDDVEGARKCGMKGILVKTGKYRHGDEHRLNSHPDAVCDDIASAVDLILSQWT